MNIHQDIPQRLSKAKTNLIFDHPFFGYLCVRLDLVEDNTEPTMSTDGRKIFYNAEFVASTTDAELLGIIAHEVLHCAMQHHTRMGERELKRWNHAADYAINPLLIGDGFTLPKGAFNNPAYAGLSAEQVYEQMPKAPPSGGKGKGENQSGSGQGKPEDEENDEEGEPGESGGQGEEKEEDQPQPGGVRPAPEPTQDEAEWTVAVKQAAQTAQMMGNMPAGIKAVVDQILKPRVDWRSLTRRWAQQLSKADYSWKRPNPRYIQAGVYLPQIHSEAMPPIVCVIDTSGSTQAVIPIFKAEFKSICEELRPERVYVVMCDAHVHRVDVFERDEEVEFNFQGGGGTSFVPAYDWVRENDIEPAGMIFLTDGYGTYPTEPQYPVLWAVSGDHEQLKKSNYYPPFGDVVEIEPEYEE